MFSNKPFISAKNIITATIGTSFRTSKIILMLTWRLNYGGTVITSITQMITKLTFICRMETHVHVHRNKRFHFHAQPWSRWLATSNILERIDKTTLINIRKIATVPAESSAGALEHVLCIQHGIYSRVLQFPRTGREQAPGSSRCLTNYKLKQLKCINSHL